MNRDFEKYYLKTFDPIYRFISSRAYSKQDAEDLVGDIFFKAYGNFHKGKRKNRAWIFTIASNTLKNYYRDSKPTQTLPESLVSPENVEGDILSSERARELIIAINKLSKEDQLIVSLRYFVELPYRDISKVMKISLSAAKTRVSRALVKLKNIMGEECY